MTHDTSIIRLITNVFKIEKISRLSIPFHSLPHHKVNVKPRNEMFPVPPYWCFQCYHIDVIIFPILPSWCFQYYVNHSNYLLQCQVFNDQFLSFINTMFNKFLWFFNCQVESSKLKWSDMFFVNIYAEVNFHNISISKLRCLNLIQFHHFVILKETLKLIVANSNNNYEVIHG